MTIDHERLYSMARGISADWKVPGHTWDDLAQDVYAKCLDRFQNYESRGIKVKDPYGLAYVTIKHRLYDLRKASRRQPLFFVEDVSDAILDKPTAEQAYEHADDCRWLHGHIEKLPPKLKAAVKTKLYDLSRNEAAAELGLTPDSYSSRISQATQRLRCMAEPVCTLRFSTKAEAP